MWISAPSTDRPVIEAMHGCRVSEATCGRSSASWATRCSRSCTAATSTPGTAVPAEQHRGRPQVAHHGRRVDGGQRRHPVDDVAEQLAGDPVQTRARRSVRRRRPPGSTPPAPPPAAPSSAPPGRPPTDPAARAKPRPGDQLGQVAPGVRHLLGVVEVAVDAGLVGSPAERLGRRLEHHVPAEPLGRPRRPRPGCAPDSWAPARCRTPPAAPTSRPRSAAPPRRSRDSTRLTSRRPASSSVSSSGTAPGSRSSQWAYAVTADERVDRVAR